MSRGLWVGLVLGVWGVARSDPLASEARILETTPQAVEADLPQPWPVSVTAHVVHLHDRPGIDPYLEALEPLLHRNGIFSAHVGNIYAEVLLPQGEALLPLDRGRTAKLTLLSVDEDQVYVRVVYHYKKKRKKREVTIKLRRHKGFTFGAGRDLLLVLTPHW